jgi:hypothetical protein
MRAAEQERPHAPGYCHVACDGLKNFMHSMRGVADIAAKSAGWNRGCDAIPALTTGSEKTHHQPRRELDARRRLHRANSKAT